MKRMLVILLALTLIGCGVYYAGSEHKSTLAIAYEQNNLLRLHILANSNSESDQAEKLRVRDSLIEEFAADLTQVKTADEAERFVLNQPQRVEKAIAQAGCAHTYTVQTGVYAFPDRVYEGTLLPAGEYHAVRVVIGEGKGQNWWCVMYPPLCFEPVQDQKIHFKSYFYELFQKYVKLWEERLNEEKMDRLDTGRDNASAAGRV